MFVSSAATLAGKRSTCSVWGHMRHAGRFNDALAYLHRSLTLLRDMGWAGARPMPCGRWAMCSRQGRAEEVIGHLETGTESYRLRTSKTSTRRKRAS